MKIAAVSDLHLDINRNYPVLRVLKDEVEQSGASYLLVAGDITEDFHLASAMMKELDENSSFSVLYVPGNHDLWSPEPSRYKIDYIYSFFNDDERCLSGKEMVDGDVAFIGDVGWYDYSFGNHLRFTDDMFEKMSYMGRTWQDGIKNPWTRDNRKRCSLQLDSIENSLKRVKDKKIIAVNAFLGSTSFGKMFEDNKVCYSISGHVHYRKEVEKSGVNYICPCLGYYSEWKFAKGHETDLLYHIRASLRYFEI